MLRIRRSPYRAIERRLGYAFRQHRLLETALIHRSFRFETSGVTDDNQRMEFLGDAALGLVAAAHVYRVHEEHDEGVLTEIRSRITCGHALARIARELDLGPLIRMGKGEEQTGGRTRPSILADALEAVIGAAYLDGGLRAVERIYNTLFAPLVAGQGKAARVGNPKGDLQQIAQREHRTDPRYRLVRSEGPSHQKVFTVDVLLGQTVIAEGSGLSRREAEARAATHAIELLTRGDTGGLKLPPGPGAKRRSHTSRRPADRHAAG
jgi:ribonuclease-3